MKTLINTDTNHRLHRYIFLFVFISIGCFGLSSPIRAEETPTSTPEIPDEISTSTLPMPEEETPTSTPQIPENNATSTPPATEETASSTPQININLNLRYQNNLIFSGLVSLPTSTTITDNSGAEHFTTSTNVLTALIAADAMSADFSVTDLQYYEDWQSFYLNCLEITTPTTTLLCGNWNYVVDGIYPSVGLDQYALQGDENIYLYFDNPWKITASSSTFPLNTTTTLQTWRYNYDNLENEWTADPNNLIDISVDNPESAGWWDATMTVTTTTSNAEGAVDYIFFATGTYYAKITSLDWSKWSNPLTLIVLDIPASATTTSSTDDNGGNDNNNGGGGGGSNPPPPASQTLSQAEINQAADKILNYLKSQQDKTGKIVDGTITDWAIMSFGANGQYAEKIKKEGGQSLLDYEKNYNLDDPSDLNACASYPRHILALLSAGVGKDDAAAQGLKNKIKNDCYKDELYGLVGINDDVFALIALLAIDESPNEPIIQSTINTIKADQNADGAFTWVGWAGADMTGAALNALKYAESRGVVIEQEIYSKARQYLKTNQLADGGWGYGASDILTTSWALMGINALGEGQSDWFTTSSTNPWHPLINQLKTDGYYEPSWAPGTVDWFAVKHAVPALLGKSWPIIMPVKIAKFETGSDITYTGGGGVYTPPLLEAATTTCTDALQCVSTPTTTPDHFTTSSLNHDITATTTINSVTNTPEITTSTEPMTLITETAATTTITNNPASSAGRQETNYKQIQNFNKPLNNLTIQPFNTTTEQQANTPTPTYFLSATTSSTPPAANPAKTVFGISLTAASGLGLYLAWRLLQTLI